MLNVLSELVEAQIEVTQGLRCETGQPKDPTSF
jgi:hypothetical protein